MTKRKPKFSTNAEPSGLHGALPYGPQKSLLTDGELRFYRDGLLPAVGRSHKIMVKVRLTDVLKVPERLWKTDFGYAVQKRHVDFVLVKKKTLEVVAAIELDDSSHLDEYRQRQDAYLGDALLAAGVPLLRMPVLRRYNPEKLRRLIFSTLKRHPLNAKPVTTRRNGLTWLWSSLKASTA